MHVLICSSNPEIVRMVSREFNQNGHRLTVCESRLEVLGAAEVIRADLLIVDMEMPGLNALLLVSAVRELAPGLPIVAVSTRPQVEDARAMSQKGVAWATLPSDGAEGSAHPVLAELAQIGGTPGA